MFLKVNLLVGNDCRLVARKQPGEAAVWSSLDETFLNIIVLGYFDLENIYFRYQLMRAEYFKCSRILDGPYGILVLMYSVAVFSETLQNQ